jgi:hypothetical protein
MNQFKEIADLNIPGLRIDNSLINKLAPSYLIEAHEAIESWRLNFPTGENTGVRTTFGVPSLVVRIDCAPNNSLNVIGVKPSSVGCGLMKILHPRFKENLEKIKSAWPEVCYLESPKMAGKHDSALWLKKKECGQLNKSDLVFINADEDELNSEYAYMNISATPLFDRSDRSYGKNWLWEEVTFTEIDDLNWEEGFCLKTKKGMNMQGVYIFYPRLKELKKEGLHRGVSYNKICRVLREENMYRQPFIRAIFLPSGPPTVSSLFFLYNPLSDSFIYSGGLSISRFDLKVCSLYNATVGLIN